MDGNPCGIHLGLRFISSAPRTWSVGNDLVVLFASPCYTTEVWGSMGTIKGHGQEIRCLGEGLGRVGVGFALI